MIRIEELINLKPVTIGPETYLVEAVSLMTKNGIKIVPVVDQSSVLVGMLRERDLIKNSSFMHLSTLYKLLHKFDYYKRDKSLIENDLKQIMSLKVKDVMSTNLHSVNEKATIEEALNIFSKSDSDVLPVVDKKNRVVGVITLTDLTRYYGVSLKSSSTDREIDRRVDDFVEHFGRQFVVVSKLHTKMWLLFSILFTFLGFFIATLFLIRITLG